MQRAYVLIADFVGDRPGVLTVAQGEIVTLVQSQDPVPPGWVLASHNGVIGFLPESYLQEVVASPPTPAITIAVGLADFMPGGRQEIAVRAAGALLKTPRPLLNFQQRL